MPFSPVKLELRRRFGSIKAFEEAKGLRPYAVRDYLRGKSVSAAEKAISEEVGAHLLERPRLKQRRRSIDTIGEKVDMIESQIAILLRDLAEAKAALQALQQP